MGQKRSGNGDAPTWSVCSQNCWFTETHSEKQEVSKVINPTSTSIDTKVSHGSCRNLPSLLKGSVDHECPDSLDDVGEHSSSANTGNASEVEKEHISVSMVPTKNNVPLVLRVLRDFNAPGKLEDSVIHKRSGQK